MKLPSENLGARAAGKSQRYEPSAVSRRKPSLKEELGPGKTETEALESTRNSRLDRVSRTNRRVGGFMCMLSARGTADRRRGIEGPGIS